MGGLGESRTLEGVGWLGHEDLKNFAPSLETKLGWRLISLENLWTAVVKRKYIDPTPFGEWLRTLFKRHSQASVVWKAMVESINIIEQGLA